MGSIPIFPTSLFEVKSMTTKAEVVPLPKPMRLPLHFLKEGDWFRLGEDEAAPDRIGVVEDNPGNLLDVKVLITQHLGKDCAFRPPPWSAMTAIYRIKPPALFSEDEEALPEISKPPAPKPKKQLPDRLGCKPSGQSGRINAAIGDDTRTVSQICKDTGFPESRVLGHCEFHVKKALKEGYPYAFRMEKVGEDGFKIVEIKTSTKPRKKKGK